MFCTTLRSASTARFGTQSTVHSGSVVTWLMVGGTKRLSMASAQPIAPSALAAPMLCPSIDFTDTVRGGVSPNTCRMAPTSMALMRAGFAGAGSQAVTIRVPMVLRALDTLCTGAWSRATPAQSYRRVSARGRTAIARQVLGCLTAGRTGEVAAQSLGLSVRTYRRHVAELMQELGAVSRFQAGVHAVELGLLAPESNAA